jgi:hypothetical protein
MHKGVEDKESGVRACRTLPSNPLPVLLLLLLPLPLLLLLLLALIML